MNAVRFQPRDLQAEPSVAPFLDGLGLGAFVPGTLQSFGGRNDNWAGTTTTGAQVFVKRVQRGQDPGPDRFTRSVSFETMARRTGAATPAAPACLGWDDDNGLIAFELIADARPANEMAMAGEFDARLGRLAGRITGRLHSMASGTGELDTSPPVPPDLGWLTALPWEVLPQVTMAELEALRIMQNDAEVVAALRRMRAAEAEAPPVPIHGDLRLDQFLVHQGSLYLTDWEEFRLGDPARDLGTVVGECLHRAILAIVERSGGPIDSDAALTPREVVTLATEQLRRQRPVIEAYCAGYREIRPIDRDLAVRSASFAGWHMFDRLYASGQQRSRLSSLHRAAAGVGRTVLLDPAGAAGRLGLL
jgi:hypothetical protein